jgi:hypothetical protein
MLLTQKAFAEGGRLLALYAYTQEDIHKRSPDAGERERAEALVSFLTPIVKALLTETAIECTYDALQIFGGHGYIVEHGMEQFARDARITTLYEGTTQIQALDLLGRKVMQLQGAGLKHFLLEISAFCEKHASDVELGAFVGPLAVATKEWSALTMDVAKRAAANPDEMGAAAYDYLFYSGYVALAYFWARSVVVAASRPAIRDAKLQTARFYFARILPRIGMHAAAIRAGASTLLDITDADFG